MDTITHGIAGALIGKSVFRGEDLFTSKPMNRARLITWSLMLGAIFPDSDMVREFLSRDPMLILTWHRSITHSLVCLPIFAVLLGAVTRWFARWRKWDSPSFAALTGIYAVGILSHIFLDVITTFGTMIWSPIRWTRAAWDLIFIIDLSFTAILLCPQFLAWAYRKEEGLKNRAILFWSILSLTSVGVAAFLKNVGAPISAQTAIIIIMLLAVLFLLPAIRNAGVRIPYAAWNRAGLVVAILYLGGTFFAHRAAEERVKQFAALFQLKVESLAALPEPPSLWQWDGLVNTPSGVFEVRLDLSANESLDNIEHSFYPDSFPNRYIEAAKQLHAVQTVLWFSRFPVTRFHMEGKNAVVEFLDIRFRSPRRDRRGGFTYRVQLDGDAKVISQGWERE
ncbi:MAG TPA: metal-dependent hydrolase [Candidatus Acidoferrum sp.]|nr:metal-dependent hydrolase [Candidatus Acidoferrum sp.]